MPKTSGKKDFQWTDDESELLLTVTHQYKIQKITQGENWESVKSKYADILKLMTAELPSTPEELKQCVKDYHHTADEMTKDILSNKLKAIRLKFRKAVDEGRKSGNGRVVFLYYELCEKIWGGSPATEQLDSGLETADISSSGHKPEDATSEDKSESDDSEPEPEEKEGSAQSEPPSKKRREYLDGILRGYKDKKLTKKMSLDDKLFHCAQQELDMKKTLIDKLDQMDKQHERTISSLTSNLEKLSNSIAEGFSLLKHVMTPQPMHPHPYTYPTTSHPPLSSQGFRPIPPLVHRPHVLSPSSSLDSRNSSPHQMHTSPPPQGRVGIPSPIPHAESPSPVSNFSYDHYPYEFDSACESSTIKK